MAAGGLTQSYLAKANYHDAAEKWLILHKPGTVLCFVQFKDVQFIEIPRMYLATPAEVTARLKATAAGRGDRILYEKKMWGHALWQLGPQSRYQMRGDPLLNALKIYSNA
jgi:hypothetical protein